MRLLNFLLLLMPVLLWFTPAQARYKHKHRAHGTATYYSNKYEGRKTASGETFTNRGFTAASNKFRMGAYVRVVNKANGNKAYVHINDRMGNNGHLIDVTTATADMLGFRKAGTANVKVKVVKPGKARRKIRRQSRQELTEPPRYG